MWNSDGTRIEEEKLTAALDSYFGEDGYTIKGNEDAGWTITVEEVSLFVTNTGNIITDGISAGDIYDSDNPGDYYGEEVDYTVEDETIQATLEEEEITWRIFYADEINIYLIASDYIPVTLMPANSSGATPKYTATSITELLLGENYYDYRVYLNNIYSVYNGAKDIKNKKIIALNSLFYQEYPTSTNTNMKAVAYILDTDLWSGFSGEWAEYAIGSPTLELFVKSWNAKGYTELFCDNVTSSGYYIGKSSGTTSTKVSDLDTSDDLYVITKYNRAYALQLASPANTSSNALMEVYCTGYIYSALVSVPDCGLRPIICLKSSVQLEEKVDSNGNTYYSIISE